MSLESAKETSGGIGSTGFRALGSGVSSDSGFMA
jgi:hypothetical protein